MDKLILLSIIFATIAIPSACARISSPRRGMVLNLLIMAVFVFAYTFAVLYIAVDYIDTTPPPGWRM